MQTGKYRLEHIPEDACQGPTLVVAPWFDNVLDSNAFGAETIWPENETLHTRPTVGTVAAMERFEIPQPDSGLWGRAIAWWMRMQELARETRLSFAGHEGRVEVGTLKIGGLDPHMIAVDLVGTDFYAWQLECPDACHRFLEKITLGLIGAQRHFLALDPRPRTVLALAADTATAMSAQLFRFALGDGANVCPGTPLENLGVFVEAAEEYASCREEPCGMPGRDGQASAGAWPHRESTP